MMYETNFYEEETLFDFDDADFIKCTPQSRRQTGTSHYVSTCYSIPEEQLNDTLPNYIHSDKTGIHCKSLPVLIPLDNSNIMRQAVEVEARRNTSSWCSDRGVLTLDDIRTQYTTENVLTLEELKNHLNSCFSCGVSWTEEHVSLDCFECGGYSMERPCPICDGKCNRTWRRDLTMSHTMRKAHWEGECGLAPSEQEAFFLKNLVDATEDSITKALEDLKASS